MRETVGIGALIAFAISLKVSLGTASVNASMTARHFLIDAAP